MLVTEVMKGEAALRIGYDVGDVGEVASEQGKLRYGTHYEQWSAAKGQSPCRSS